MFAFGKAFARTSLPLLALGLSTWVATTPLSAAERGPANAVPLVAGETWRSPGGAPGDDSTLSIRLDAPGLLLIDVDVPVAAAAVRLVLLRPQASGKADFQILEQSPTALALAASPGDYVVRVAADDPRQPLAPWRLRTRFAASALDSASLWKSGTSPQIEVDPDPQTPSGTRPQIEVDPDPNKSGTSPQIEADPDPQTPSGTRPQIEVDPDPSKSETSPQIEVDPDPHAPSGTRPQIEVDPDPVKGIGWSSGSSSAASRLLRQLCRQGEIDDHGDSFACATPLKPGIRAQGALGNDHGDDSDVFRFEVSALAPVELRARASFALAGELYDGHGQRLDTAVAEGRGGLRLVRTLVPGTYFLRLQGGNGAEGAYTVAFGSPQKDR